MVQIGWRSDEFKLLSRDEATILGTSLSPIGAPNAIFEASSSQDIISLLKVKHEYQDMKIDLDLNTGIEK